MKNITSLIGIASFISLIVVGCECKETVDCEGVSSKALSALPNKPLSMEFTDGKDSSLTFFSANDRNVIPTTLDCETRGYNKCECPDCPPPNYSQVMKLDQQVYNHKLNRYTDEYYVTVYECNDHGEQDNVCYFLGFLDFLVSYQFKVTPNSVALENSSLDPADKILDSLRTPTKVYRNIVCHNVRERDVIPHGYIINKIYISLSEGMVAFESAEGNFFYRRN